MNKRSTGKRRLSLLTAAMVILLLIVGSGVYLWQTSKGPIPEKIKSQINFLVFYPSSSNLAVAKESLKYDQGSKVFSYIVTDGNTKITIAEQETPQSFVDIPQAYDKLTEKLNEYSRFDSYYGTVSLIYPQEFNKQQSAVMNSKGTLIFAHPTNGSLSDEQWKLFFNSLNIIK